VPLLEPEDANFWQVFDVLVELFLQPRMRLGITGVVDEDNVAEDLGRRRLKKKLKLSLQRLQNPNTKLFS